MGKTLPLILLALLAGCASSDRLARISPFSSHGRGDPERVNLWPLAYASKGSLAILWPLMDVDDKGFAIRPLVARDGDKLDVLFPWSYWNLETGTGWAAPFYRLASSAGLFPIAHVGSFNYVGPVWWYEGEKRSTGGLFPVATFGAPAGGARLSYVGPVWWTEDGGGVQSAGLLPLFTLGAFNHVGPVWWTKPAGEGQARSLGVFPLFATGDLKHVGPVWWTGEGQGGLFPLVWIDRESDSFTVLPLYSGHQQGGKAVQNWLLGLVHFDRDGDESRRWALPLWYESESPNESTEVLLPFFVRLREGDRSHVFTLLGDRSVADDGTSFNVYPLWWSAQSGDDATRLLVPLFYYDRKGERRTLVTPLGGKGWDASGNTQFVNVLGPLYHHSEGAGDSLTTFLWPLFERRREGPEVTTRVAPLLSVTTSPEGSDSWWLGGLGHHRTRDTGTAWRLWPLLSSASAAAVPGPLYNWTLMGRQSAAEGATSRSWLFPLYHGIEAGTRKEHSWLLGTGRYRQSGDRQLVRQWPLFSVSDEQGTPDLLHHFSLYGRHASDELDSVHVGTPLLFHLKRQDAGESWRTHVLTVLSAHDERSTPAEVPVPRRQHPRNRVASAGFEILWGAFRNVHETYHVWREDGLTEPERNVLARWTRHRGQDEELTALLEQHLGPSAAGSQQEGRVHQLVADSTEELSVWHHRVPLLFEYEKAGDELEWDLLWRLIHVDRRPDVQRLNLLYYFYRQERQGERVSRDIFPFITYDSAPEEVDFSFLWRLFRYQRRGERTGGHILFIPWGD